MPSRINWQNVLLSPAFWILMVFVVGGLMFWLGTAKGRDWAEDSYLAEREERMAAIAVHEAKAKELAAENEKLKAENDAKAEILRQADTAAEAKKAQEFQRLQDERDAKQNEIENADPQQSIAGLCDDAKRAGYTLSFCR